MSFQDQFSEVDALARGDAVLRARLETIAGMAVRLLEPCDSASIALLLEGRSTTVAITDHVALEVDLVQYRTHEGPCLDAVGEQGHVVRIDLLDNSTTYRRMAPGALDIGVNSVLSVPFYDGSTVIGSLNLYSRRRDGFDAACEAAARPFAEAASEAVVGGNLHTAAQELLAGIVSAMEDESLINQAIGLIMHRKACTVDAARRILEGRVRASGGAAADEARAVLHDPDRIGPRPAEPPPRMW